MLTIDPPPRRRIGSITALIPMNGAELVDLEDPPDRLDRGVGDRGQMQDRRVVHEDGDVTGRLDECGPVGLLR